MYHNELAHSIIRSQRAKSRERYCGRSSRARHLLIEPDCRTCNRRRIRCDRSLPTCKKCALKELACPGYGLRIQFGQGVASRGNLKGKSLPIIEAAPGDDSKACSLTNEPPTSLSERGSDPSSTWTDEQIERSAVFQCPFAIGLDMSSLLLPDYLYGKPVRELINYYDHHVAGLFPWVDNESNPWRILLLPLAREAPSLLLALLALSAEHYRSKSSDHWPVQNGFDAGHYRDRSLVELAKSLRIEVEAATVPARQTQASGIIATILVLCNMEMIRCDSDSTWHVHWKAARLIAKRWSHLPTNALDETCRFLLKEAFM
jgi:hypothetical protein